MNRQQLDKLFDDVTSDIRNHQPDDATVRIAAERSWKRIANERDALADLGSTALQNASQPDLNSSHEVTHIRGCDDFQALIPAYLSGQLSAARVLLFEDHTRECVPCRKAFKAARAGQNRDTAVKAPVEVTRPRNLWNPSMTKWAIAAVVVVAFGFVGMRFIQSVGALNAVVQAANGPIYRVTDARVTPVNAGEKIQKGERIRTAKGARAVVKLADSSLVEVSERAEFYITENGDGTTVHLDRGNVIVQAAKQKSKHLFVQTDDALVSVKGTIFSVNSGTKGSRVSVIEGEVHVDHSGKQDVLKPGDQVTTNTSIDRVPVQEEVSWSRDASRYIELLNQLMALRKDLNNVPRPGLHYSTQLLDLMPEGTVFYAAVPNLSATLAESHKIIEERISQNEALRDWWQNAHNKSQHSMNNAFDKIREFGAYLGEEIVLSAELSSQGKPDGPLIVAQLRDASGFRNFVEQQLSQLSDEAKKSHLHIIDDPATAQALPNNDGLLLWINGDLLAASPDLALLQRLALTLKAPQANRFKDTSFYARIAERYQAGTSLLIAADLEKITPHVAHTNTSEQDPDHNRLVDASRQLGLLNLKHFIAEVREVDGKGQNSAVLSFNEANRGVASWLAQPGPMGALELISPDASMVGAFVVNQPTKLVDDLFSTLKIVEPKFEEHMAEFERTHGINIRSDFAAPLGGEFAFAMDGPVLPTPSWKLIFEVYDAAKLQATLERLTGEMNTWLQKEGKKGVTLEKTEESGRTYYTLKSLDANFEMNYAFVSGYLIAAPSRVLIDRAISYRDSGYTLTHSQRFIAALPADKQANFSALVYQNLGSIISPIAKQAGAVNLPEGSQQAIKSLTDSAPTLAYAYAYGDRIVLSLNNQDGSSILNPATWVALPGLSVLHDAHRQKTSTEGVANN